MKIQAIGESKLSDSPESFQYQVSLLGNGEGLSMADKSELYSTTVTVFAFVHIYNTYGKLKVILI